MYKAVEESGKIDGKGDEDKPLLDKTVFKQYVIPRLVKMFSVKDYHIHMTLLKYFEYFVHLVDVEALEFDVFPQVSIEIFINPHFTHFINPSKVLLNAKADDANIF